MTVGFVGGSATVAEDGGSVDVLVSLEQEVAIPLSVDLVILSATAMEGQGIAILTALSTFIELVRLFCFRFQCDIEFKANVQSKAESVVHSVYCG